MVKEKEMSLFEQFSKIDILKINNNNFEACKVKIIEMINNNNSKEKK